MSISTVPIRAEIRLGDVVIKTPYILSFSVNKQRNSKSTFQASLKIEADDLNAINDNKITIYAGTKNRVRKIFTGFVLNSTPSPCWDNPKYVILNVSGADTLYRLEYERYTRRQITSAGTWAVITGIQRKGPKSGKFRLVNYDTLIPTDGDIATYDQNTDKQLNINDLNRYSIAVPAVQPEDIKINIKTVNT